MYATKCREINSGKNRIKQEGEQLQAHERRAVWLFPVAGLKVAPGSAHPTIGVYVFPHSRICGCAG